MASAPEQDRSLKARFRLLADSVANAVGTPAAFAVSVSLILMWALTGPLFHFSDTWQLVINTGTTVVTFLIVFLIQNTQNRDAKAIHLKLDELIRALGGARNSLIDAEKLSDEEMDRVRAQFSRIDEEAGRLADRPPRGGDG